MHDGVDGDLHFVADTEEQGAGVLHAPFHVGDLEEAIHGNGGVARLVFLPFEAHGYRGKETIEHVLWEKMTWLDKYVKNARPPSN